MMFAKRVVVLLLSIIVSYTVNAQYTEEDGGIETESGYLRYVYFGAGAAHQYMYDEAISPIYYSNIVGFKPEIGLMKVSSSYFHEFTLSASSINLKHNKEKLLDSKVRAQRASMDYRFMLTMPVGMRNIKVHAGGIFSGMFAHKNAPHLLAASDVYEYAVSLGLSARVTSELTMWGKTAFFSWDLAMPLLTNASRPYYLNRVKVSDPDNKPVKEFFDNASTGSFGKYFRLNSRVSLLYRLDNGNGVMLRYMWDYSRFKTVNKAYFAEHSLSLVFMFNF